MQPSSVALRSPHGTPYGFELTISSFEAQAGAPRYEFRIAATPALEAENRVREYRLFGTQPDDYLDFLEAVARDFEIRMPSHRMPQERPAFRAAYSELLTRNLCSEILYGYGDPAILSVQVPGLHGESRIWQYITCTSNDAPNCFPLIRTADLKSWEPRGFIFPHGRTPEWATTGRDVSDYWAPEIHMVQGRFQAYFVARDSDTHDLCIGVAVAETVEGPYVAEREPLLRGNRIDPHVFAENGVAYLYWKEDSNALWPFELCDLLATHPNLICKLYSDAKDQRTASLAVTLWPWARQLEPMERSRALQPFSESVTLNFASFRTRLSELAGMERDQEVRTLQMQVLTHLKTIVYAQLLSDDGLRLCGQPQPVMDNDQNWEAHVIEGIWLTQFAGKYFLFYSGNDFSTPRYGIGVAVADSPLGPFRKRPEPLLQSTPEWIAPGHCSFAVINGQGTLFFHAYRPGKVGFKQFRALLSTSVRLDGEEVLVGASRA